ncbi:MAG: hypothetical protein RL215_2579 [Planctomycetota bacterium]
MEGVNAVCGQRGVKKLDEFVVFLCGGDFSKEECGFILAEYGKVLDIEETEEGLIAI